MVINVPLQHRRMPAIYLFMRVFAFFFFFFYTVLQHRCPVNSLSCLSISHCTTKAALLIQSTFSTGLAAETGCLHLDKRTENMQNNEKSMYVGRRVAVCVRPLMYVKTDVCAQTLSVCIVSARLRVACVCTFAKP